MTDMYLIVCTRHTGAYKGLTLFWRPNSASYTTNIDEAGRYTKEKADEISESTHGDDYGIPESVVMKMRLVRGVDINEISTWRKTQEELV